MPFETKKNFMTRPGHLGRALVREQLANAGEAYRGGASPTHKTTRAGQARPSSPALPSCVSVRNGVKFFTPYNGIVDRRRKWATKSRCASTHASSESAPKHRHLHSADLDTTYVSSFCVASIYKLETIVISALKLRSDRDVTPAVGPRR